MVGARARARRAERILDAGERGLAVVDHVCLARRAVALTYGLGDTSGHELKTGRAAGLRGRRRPALWRQRASNASPANFST